MDRARRRRAKARERSTGILLIAGVLLVSVGLAGFSRYAYLIPLSFGSAPTQAPLLRPTHTATPFRPLAPTATHIPTATSTPRPTPEPPRPILRLDDLDERQRITLRLFPGTSLDSGKAIDVSFLPGDDCPFGSQRACLSLHRGGTMTLLTIHSGVGGQGEAFRRAVEGSGLDSALYGLSKIQANLDALEDAPAALHIGDGAQTDLTLVGVARIPPMDLEQYFALPVDQALEIAAFYNPALKPALAGDDALLAFEICGWKVGSEGWGEGVSSTTGSIYFGLLRRP